MRRFERYRTIREISRPTGNGFADFRNLTEALRLIRLKETDTAPMQRIGQIAEIEKVDVVEQVFAIARAGGLRPEAADHFVKHLRQARARLAADGTDTAEMRREKEQAERKAVTARLIEDERHRMLGKARIPFAMHTANFETTENGKPLNVDERNRKAHHWAKELSTRWVPKHRGLTLSGGVGCGKTYLATAVLVAVVAAHGKDARAIMVTERDLLRFFRQSYGKSAADPYTPSVTEAREHFVLRPELLILDDFGAEQPSAAEKGDWARGQIMDLVEYRSREKKTTIVTTNLTEDEISKRYDNRILSRLTGHSPWQTMAGPDFRQTVAPDSDDPFEADKLVMEFNQ